MSSRKASVPDSSTSATLTPSEPGAPRFARTSPQALARTSLRTTLSYRAWNLRFGACFPGRRPGDEEGLSSSHDTLPTVPRPNAPGGSWAPAPGSLVPSMAFANPTEARLPLGPARARVLVTTLQASLHTADRPV